MRHRSRRFLASCRSFLLLAAAALACGCEEKKSEPTYADNVVGAMREAKASDARGDMQSIAIAITQWIANDGNLADAPDFPALVTALEPNWLRVVPRTDPWGAAYAFRTDGSSWELRTHGRDGVPGNADDMVMVDGQVTQMPASFSPVGRN